MQSFRWNLTGLRPGIWPTQFPWKMWAAPKNYLPRIDWMLGTGLSWIISNFALLFKLTESCGNHFVSSYAVNWLNCQFVKNPKPYNVGCDLAFYIVKYFVFNLLTVCVGQSVLTQYYLHIFTIYTAPMLEIKIHTRARIVPMWAIKPGTV